MLSQKDISKKAFTLVETLIVIGIMSLISIGVIQQLQKQAEQQKATAAGQRISEAGRALQNYVEANKVALLNAIPAGTTRVADFCILNTFSPSDCNTTSGGAALPVDAVLPESFRNDSLFNTGYKIALKNVDNIDVIGLLYTDDSVYLNSSSEPRYDLLGAATKAAGSAVGFADKSGNAIKGLNGSWEITRADNLSPSSINWADQITPGILAYRTGAEDRFDDTYVRRDGTTELTGDLLLGNNNIKNINSISFDNYMVGQNGYLQNLRTQSIYNAGDIFSNTLNSQRTYTAELHTNKINTSDSSNQDLLIGANGNNENTAAGNLYAGNLTANQSILAKQELTTNGSLTVDGNAFVYGKTTLDSDLQVNGRADVQGKILSQQESAGQTLRATLKVARNSSCAAYEPGSIATSNDGKGNILSCQQGKWKLLAGATPNMYAFFGTPTCPDGWIAANGANGTYDLRGNFVRGVGGNSAALGVKQGDAIRNITGRTRFASDKNDSSAIGPVGNYTNGAFVASLSRPTAYIMDSGGYNEGSGYDYNTSDRRLSLDLDASRVVPTANENRPVNIALTACMKTE